MHACTDRSVGRSVGRHLTIAPIRCVPFPNISGDDADAAGADTGDGGQANCGLPQLCLSRPEIVVNADGARGTPTVVARRQAEEGADGQEEEWLVGVSD